MRERAFTLVLIGWLAAFRRICWSFILVAASAASTAQDFDEKDPHALAEHRFDLARRASKDADESLPGFLQRLVAVTSESELVQLGSMPQAWTHGGEQPSLYRAFVSDSVFESRLDEVLPALETLLQRVPALAQQAPWQSLLARAQLKTGQLSLALASAQRAWALDRRLCAKECAPLLRTWLHNGQVAAPAQWPALAIEPVYNPGSVDCTSRQQSQDERPLSIIWQIPEVELVAATRGDDGRLAWLLRQAWAAHLAGCSSVPYGLQQVIDDRYPRIVVEQAWLGVERALRAGPGTAIDFLGVRLPLPEFECDFKRDPDCRSGQQALRPATALVLAEGLRAFSRHLAAPGQCPAPTDAVAAANFISLQQRFRALLKTLDAEAPAAARQGLKALLADPQWRPMWRNDVPYELRRSLALQARSGAADEVVQMVQALLDHAPDALVRSEGAADVLAFHLLRARRAEAGLLQLQLAQQRRPQLARAQRIAQLQAGLGGADLDASIPLGTPTRPWISGKGSSDSAVGRAWPFWITRSLDGVLAADVVYALGGDRAVARRALKELWVPALLESHNANAELASALQRGYSADASAQLLRQAQASFRAAPEPVMSFDGVLLLLPDQYCVDQQCKTILPVDAAWGAQRLRSLLAR